MARASWTRSSLRPPGSSLCIGQSFFPIPVPLSQIPGGTWYPLYPYLGDKFLCPVLHLASALLLLEADMIVAGRPLQCSCCPAPVSSSSSLFTTDLDGIYIFPATKHGRSDLSTPLGESAVTDTLQAGASALFPWLPSLSFHFTRHCIQGRMALAGMGEIMGLTYGGWAPGGKAPMYSHQTYDTMNAASRILSGAPRIVEPDIAPYGFTTTFTLPGGNHSPHCPTLLTAFARHVVTAAVRDPLATLPSSFHASTPTTLTHRDVLVAMRVAVPVYVDPVPAVTPYIAQGGGSPVRISMSPTELASAGAAVVSGALTALGSSLRAFSPASAMRRIAAFVGGGEAAAAAADVDVAVHGAAAAAREGGGACIPSASATLALHGWAIAPKYWVSGLPGLPPLREWRVYGRYRWDPTDKK